MADAISIQELIDARTDAKTLEQAVNGDAVTTVLSRLGESYPTLANALSQIDGKLDSADAQIKQGITNLFENGGLPATPFASKALMTASALVDGQYAMVTDDTVNNGLYVKTAGVWVKSSYDPIGAISTISSRVSEVVARIANGNATLVYGKESFTEPSYNSGYSQTKPIAVAGFSKVFVKIQSRLSIDYSVKGVTKAGGVVEISAPVGSRNNVLIEGYDIPDNVEHIIVAAVNSSSPDFIENFPPLVILGNDDAHIRERYESIIKGEIVSGFPDKGIYPYPGDYTTFDSTYLIPVSKGSTVDLHLNSPSRIGLYFNGKTKTTTYFYTGDTKIIVAEDGYIRLTTTNSEHGLHIAGFNARYTINYPSDIKESSSSIGYIQGNYLPTPVLKAVREVTFLDGTDQTAIQYLWHDADWNFYLSSSLRGDKKLIMKWSAESFNGVYPHNYSMNFDNYGNIVCVYRIEQWTHKNNDDSIRKNPIIFIKDENYKPVTVDFGSEKKPSGWIQNCGFLCTDEAIYITEYTRPSVATANTWKATYPLTDANNWQAVQAFTLSSSTNPSTGVKHMHNVDRDPFTGIVYTTSGDLDPAIYASYDKGSTFSVIASGSEKFHRILNFIFTKDFIYWASDVATPRPNFLFKAARKEDGTLDTANIVEIAALPSDSRAVYAAIYMKKIDAIVLLQREDATATSVPIDIWDMKNNMLSRLDVIPSVAGLSKPLGFRCETFEYYPRGNEIPCGFSVTLGQGGYENHLGILGNTANADAKVGNVVLTIERLNDTFSVSYDTIA